ncbi:hypothetical protein BpHYR1_051351 [Brachionus plicatilis]|uniref:Uncharacterized protein n=1 Tax=Brachionus plicatilis TaxID=10195 RepID=A0A3M7PWR3_BRAPC|nr:hypothetical protein BpHYR1_051351 [Brachionus plicatilis]
MGVSYTEDPLFETTSYIFNAIYTRSVSRAHPFSNYFGLITSGLFCLNMKVSSSVGISIDRKIYPNLSEDILFGLRLLMRIKYLAILKKNFLK